MREIWSWAVLGLLVTRGACGESSSKEALSERTRLDLAWFGYVFRADAPAGPNPPEAPWLPKDQPDVLAGVLWEEHRGQRLGETLNVLEDIICRDTEVIHLGGWTGGVTARAHC